MVKFLRRKKTPNPVLEFPLVPVEYPTGVCVKTAKGTYLINKDGKRYRVLTKAIEQSWNFPITVVTTELALANYPVAVTKLGFRDGTLLINIADGRMYLVSESKLRHIVSPRVLERLNVTREDAKVVSDAEINLMKFGDAIS